MALDELTALVDRIVASSLGDARPLWRIFGHISVVRYPATTSFESALYEPAFCLILQGRKETTLGATTFQVGVGDCLLISHDVPVVSRVTIAPYLALVFDVRLDTLRELYDDVADRLPAAGDGRALHADLADAPLVDALHRYVSLVGAADDARVLGPLVAKEVHYRLLMASFGGTLRNLVQRDSHASAIARAIAEIRRNFRSPMEVPALARSVGMSISAFHKHFKDVTASSPLRYQKDLRLLEARRLLRAGAASVSAAAFAVGYESPTQFSREYARKFGVTPKRDRPGRGGSWRAAAAPESDERRPVA